MEMPNMCISISEIHEKIRAFPDFFIGARGIIKAGFAVGCAITLKFFCFRPNLLVADLTRQKGTLVYINECTRNSS